MRPSGLGVVPYFALASGFLTGKYRPGAERRDARGRRGWRATILNERGLAALAALDEVAAAHDASPAQV